MSRKNGETWGTLRRRFFPSDGFRYTLGNVRKRASVLASFLLVGATVAVNLCFAADVSFHRVKVPDAKGRQNSAVLTFSDTDKAVEVRPLKGDTTTIPYSAIAQCSYEFTRKHRVNGGTIATSPVGVGAVMMLTKSKSHWLEIDYNEQGVAKAFVLRMDKREYLQILEALKAHTGIDAQVLGNAANKR